jgi:hypothetical protein
MNAPVRRRIDESFITPSNPMHTFVRSSPRICTTPSACDNGGGELSGVGCADAGADFGGDDMSGVPNKEARRPCCLEKVRRFTQRVNSCVTRFTQRKSVICYLCCYLLFMLLFVIYVVICYLCCYLCCVVL